MWQPGKSGNPGGRGGEFQKCQTLCRTKSEAAAKRMFQLAYLNEIDETGELAPVPINADKRIVYMASQWVYENAWGKPKAAMRERMWQKGQSGNPGGKRGEYYEMQRMCREASPAAAERLIEMAYLNAIDETGRLAPLPINADRRIVSWAVDKLMERAWGQAEGV
jgi:hypothetical protein